MRALVAALAVGAGLLAAPAFAQEAKPAAEAGASAYDELEQIQLSDGQVKNYVASLKDMQAAMGDAPADAAEPDAKTMAKLETIAKKYGFKDFAEYNNVAGNIAMVVDGVDPETKKYVGSEKMIERSIVETKKDKQMSDADKKSAIADLQAQLKAVKPVKNKGNIDLVVKYYDQLSTDEEPAAK